MPGGGYLFLHAVEDSPVGLGETRTTTRDGETDLLVGV
jgi:hypothetical protein